MISNVVKFIAQSGGHGSTSGLSTISSEGIIVNLRTVNHVSVDHLNDTAKISARAPIGEVIDVAHAAKAHIVTGVCRRSDSDPSWRRSWSRQHDLRKTGPCFKGSHDRLPNENLDLWGGLRGAGHNFDIVSELTVKAYPQMNNGMYWTGMLAFPGAEPVLDRMLSTLGELHLETGMVAR